MSNNVLTEIQMLESIIKAVENYPHRLKTKDGRPGGLIEFPDSTEIIVVGDLHSNLNNLIRILDDDGNRADIAAGRKTLVIIGDTVHNDVMGQMKEMDTSIAMLEYIFKFMFEYPTGVVYVKGNHDTFDERLVKSGILQGKELKAALIAKKGKEYQETVARFFDALPLFIIGKGYVITHAGPVRGGIGRDELINIKDDPTKYHQLIWNRLHEFRGNPSQKEYGAHDIQATLAKLHLPADTLFIVGHNPLWGTGEKTGVWMDVLSIKNHHIIYSGSGSLAPYFLIAAGTLTLKFPEVPTTPEAADPFGKR